MHPIKQRQRVFWDWADCQLHSRSQGVVCGNGIQVDVQVRTSREGTVQLFIGGYEPNGLMVFEEYYKERSGETMTVALNWGCARAERLAVERPNSNFQSVPLAQ
ncbi:hypothetical protein [Pseudomonas sp. B28(2017)]|uniref:hypothetical protein n=1 Tax=Pseudomonas sp. B28(2017) TaxID=1981730 RepID=UPI000A1DB917|nr:hypothetical protein [Pseudomonas sp. B28(2017)]